MNKSKEYNWRIDNEIKEIFTENILAEDSGFYLYKMSPSANDINVRYGDALFTGDNSNGILETQMINDMKYMTFENLALEVMEKFKKQEEAQKEVDASEDFQDIQEDISKLDDEMEDIRSGEEHVYGLMTLMGVNTYDSDKQFPKFKKIFESSSEISANRIIGKVKTKNAFEYLKKVNDKNVMKDADDFYKTDFFYTLTNVLYVKMLISANDIQAQKDIERYNKEYKDWQNSGGSNNQGENSKPPPEPLKLWEKEKYADKLSKFDKDIKDYKETFNRLIIKINDNARKARIEITKNRSKFEKIEKDLKALKTKVEALPNNQEFKPTMKKEIEDLLEDVKRERLDELTKAFTKTEEACRYISGNGSTSMIDKFGNELKPIEDKIKNKEITVKLSDKDRKDLYRYMKDGTINSATADAIVLGKVGINNNDVKNKIINKLKPTFQKHFVNSNSLTKSNRKSFTFELEVKLKAPQFDTESGIWKEILDTFKELKKMADDSSLSNIKAPLYGEKAKVSRGDLPTNSKYEVPADDEDPETSKVINSPESNANKLSDSAIDKVYLVEYLMSNFKSMIEDTEGGAKRVPVMPEGDTALRNEVEAILFQKKGEFSDKRAVDKMTNRLLFERAALNLVGFFCDSKKIKLVRDISLAISGGFAPLTICFAAIITTGWVGYESLLDVKDLLRGGNVPLIKNKDNWIAKITIGVDENNGLIDRLPSSGNQDDLFELNGGDGDFYNEQNKLNFNYNDYLRMNLLVAKDAELINGMKDLIVKNMRMEDSEFAFHDKFTKINLEVDSRMELLFDMTAFGGKSGTINFKKINMNKGYN